jgi:hypothetical protein
MTEPRDSDSEMPSFPLPWTTRPDGRAVDALLAGTCQPEEAPAELRAVAEVFAALKAPADQREVAGWGQALIAYREVAAGPEAASRSRWRRRIAAPLGTKLAAVAGVAVVAVLGGGVAAAYTGNLPVTLQRVAHDTIAAPGVPVTRAAPTPGGPVHPVYPVGPRATGSAAYGLCQAYQHAKEHGNASQRAVAFRNLVNAAGGSGQVAAYCAAVQHPGAANPPGRRVGQPGATPTHPSHHGKPTTAPTTAPSHGNGNGNGGGNGNGNGNGKSHGQAS